MKKLLLISVIIMSFGFTQSINKDGGGQIRLSPKMVNYQGYLTDTLGNPINDSLDLIFRIFDAAGAGNLVWTETQLEVPVIKGIFHVLLGSATQIPDSVFTNSPDRWLEIRISGQNLSPRTRIVSTPYAYTAVFSDTALYARVAAADNDWIISGSNQYSAVSGNVGIGIASPRTKLDVIGTICGGVQDTVFSTYGVLPGGYHNIAGDASDDTSVTISGGWYNSASADYSFVGGGSFNSVSGRAGTISGGSDNMVLNSWSSIGGGSTNAVSGQMSAVAGGIQNQAASDYSFVGGGAGNLVNASGTVINGGSNNRIDGTYSVIGGGERNLVRGNYSGIFAGYADTIDYNGHYSYLFGINSNLTQDSTFMVDMPHVWFGTEAAGYQFPVNRGSSGQVMITDVSGQLVWSNQPAASHWTVTDSVLYTNLLWGLARGGAGNMLFGTNRYTHTNFGAYACTTGTIGQNYSYITIGGGYCNRADSTYSTVAGGTTNKAMGSYSFIGGGFNNFASGYMSLAGGGSTNTASGDFSTVGGGYMNTASSVNYSTVSGGSQNTASGEYSTVSGGGTNYASGFGSMVGGGRQNDAFGDYSTIGGGYTNYNAAQYATIPGGFYDTITTTGNFSYLFGVNSNLTQDSTFMVDMPHIWFGTEAAGYQFPVSRGSSSQVMVTDASGQLSWSNSPAASHWTVTDSVLYTNLRWGLARGGAGNILYGVNAYTHTNFGGYACTTGVNGQTQSYITICGGSGNLADSAGNTIVGGTSNRAIGRSSFIGGGWVNSTQGSFSIVVGGYLNNTDSTFAAVVGGNNNDALGQYSFIGNGNSNTAGRIYSMVGNGLANNASGYMSYIGTGYWNLAGGRYAAVTNGYADTAKGDCAAVLSGYDNLAGDSTLDTSAVVAGGWGNTARYRYSFIGGGKNNVTGGNYAAVAGGIFNTADSHYTFIGGGTTNTAAGYLSVIVGGYYNYTYGNYATIGNGFADTARGHYSAILSGSHNIAGDQMTDTASVVIGGLDNTSTGRYGLIGNGTNNSNYGTYGIVGNGYSNTTGSTAHATVLNGAYNYSDGENSLITAGYYDTVTTAGDYSLVVGRHVYLNTGYRIAFFESAYSGRLGINRDDRDGGILYPIHVGTSASNGNGAYLTVGGIWTNASSKYKKEDFCTLDGKDLLNKVAGMDITNWKFKDSEERHISPVAQDFYKAFGCGAGNIDDDSTHIAALDMAGVSLRAVQELTKMVRDQQVEIAELKAEIAKLKN